MPITQSRRGFLATTSLAAAAGVLGAPGALADDGPPETNTIRIAHWPGYACIAPQSIAEPLLRAEGFTDVRFVTQADTLGPARGEVDFELETAAAVVSMVDAGQPIVALAGVHVGCYELFAHPPVATISDLKGRRIGIDIEGGGPHMYISIMLAQVGLDPKSDVEWVIAPHGALIEPFARGEIDAILAFAPEPQELRDRKIGRVILDTAQDKPWSQYFCCMAFSNREWVQDHPIAAKRGLRAILKTADLCATQPEIAARRLVDEGFGERYDYALQTLIELPYDKWRDFDPEDSLRFFALRLHEVGMVESSPNKIIAEGADWRFVNELKRELKA
jgi:NitT/TauT family transport system substrate-binding protein